jgi:hypothetical protein
MPLIASFWCDFSHSLGTFLLLSASFWQDFASLWSNFLSSLPLFGDLGQIRGILPLFLLIFGQILAGMTGL